MQLDVLAVSKSSENKINYWFRNQNSGLVLLINQELKPIYLRVYAHAY